MERITIDVIRTKGTRAATVRVHVNPTPGAAGSTWRQGSVDLGKHGALGAEMAAHIAHSVEQGIESFVRTHSLGEQLELG